jgi:hypothetical protein
LKGRSVDDIYDEIKDILEIGIEDLRGYLTASSNTTSMVVPETLNNDNEQDPSEVSATTITFATSPPAQLYDVIIKDTTTYSPFPYEKFESNTKQTYSAAKNIKIAPFSIVVRPWRIHGLNEDLQAQTEHGGAMEDGFFECVLKVFDPIPDKHIIVNTWKTFKTNNRQNGNTNMPLLLFWTAKYFGICIRYIEKTEQRENYVASIVVVPNTSERMETSECHTTFIYYKPPKKMTTIGVTITHEKHALVAGKATAHHFAIAQYSNKINQSTRKKLTRDIARENLGCDYNNNGEVYQPGINNIFQDGHIQLAMTPFQNPNTPLWNQLSNINEENKKLLANQIVTFFNKRPQHESMHLVLWKNVNQAQIVECLQKYRYTILVEATLWYYVVFETIHGTTTTTIVNIKRTKLETNISEYKEKIKRLFPGTDMYISTIHDLISVCESTQDNVPFIICSLMLVEQNIEQKRRWWTWPNIIVNTAKKTYFTDLTEIKPKQEPNHLAWWVYNQLASGAQESTVTPSPTSSSDADSASDEDSTTPWLSCSPCLDCFAPEPKRRKRRHKAQKQSQERKRARLSTPSPINWKQAYCDLLGNQHNHGAAHLVNYNFTRAHTDGDGNCFFHAIIGSAKSFNQNREEDDDDAHVLSEFGLTVYALRLRFTANGQNTGIADKAHLSTMGEWINTDDMQYIAEQLGICIFLYGPYGPNSYGWRIFNGQNVSANNVVYIYNNGQATSGNTSGTHFETLIRHDQQNFDCNDY